MFFAICCTLVIPDFPHTTKWLTPEQQAYAAWRLKMDAEEEDDRHATGVMQGLLLAVKDWRLYVFMLMLHANVLAGTFQYIFPSIVQTLGFGRIQTLLLTVCLPRGRRSNTNRTGPGVVFGLVHRLRHNLECRPNRRPGVSHHRGVAGLGCWKHLCCSFIKCWRAIPGNVLGESS
jgi:hypothetical protein